MGTQLYAKGAFLNRSFDELNLSSPKLVGEGHRECLQAGAGILETNTFGANRLKLEPHGLAEQVRDINLAGVRMRARRLPVRPSSSGPFPRRRTSRCRARPRS